MQFASEFDNPTIWEKLDMFGINMHVRFRKQATHKTKLGGFFSVIIVVLLIIQVYYIAQNLSDSENPTVLYQQTFTKQPERFDLDPKTFSLAFGLQDSSSSHYYDPTIYTIVLWLKKTVLTYNSATKDYSKGWNNRIVKLERCTYDHFQVEKTQAYFRALKFNSLYCISKDEKDIYIEGQFDADAYAGLQIVVTGCVAGQKDSDGNDIICQDDQVIYNKLNNGRLAVYYTDNSVITRNRDNPFQAIGRQSFWVSGPQFSKSLNISFRNSYLFTDTGLIATEIEQKRALTFSFDREQTTPKNGNTLFDCYISFEKNMNSEYHRSYPKLDKALSQFGGIFNFLFAIGCLICKPLSHVEFNKKLINSLFSFEDNISNSQDISKDETTKKNFLTTALKQSSNLQQSNTENKELNGDTYPNQNKLNTSDIKLGNMNQSNNNYQARQTRQSQDVSSSLKKEDEVRQQARSKFRQKLQQNQQLQSINESSPKHQSSEGIINFSTTNKNIRASQNSFQKSRKQQLSQKQQDQMNRKEMKELESIFVSTFNQIKFKSWEYFASYFSIFSCWKSQKQTLIREGISKLHNHVDILYIVNKLLEVEKLKHLLLNDNQLKLFEFIPKPVLNPKQNDELNDNYNLGILYEDKRTIFQKALDAQSAFNVICQNNRKMSTKDKRLIELLHPNFKNLLEDRIESETDMIYEDSGIFDKNQVRKTMYTHPCNKSMDS